MDFLKNTDVLVDGRFILKELDLSILFRGSRNQRLIDVPKSLKKGEVVLFDESAYKEENKFKKQDLYI
jgi:anaerobic ribonucleoside-triphosphate reductase activating protein